MSNASLAPALVFKGFDNNGNPLANGQLFTYAAGSSTPLATYTDSTAATANTNPVILSSRGEANVNLPPNTAYKFVLEDSSGNIMWSVDQVTNAQFQSILATDTGLANAYILTVPWPSSSYTGMSIYFIPANTNTGASTVNVNGIGTVAIVNPGGGALTAGQITAGYAVFIAYSGGQFILSSPFGSNATVTIGAVNVNGTAIPANGMYEPSAGVLGLSAGGVQQATLSANGLGLQGLAGQGGGTVNALAYYTNGVLVPPNIVYDGLLNQLLPPINLTLTTGATVLASSTLIAGNYQVEIYCPFYGVTTGSQGIFFQLGGTAAWISLSTWVVNGMTNGSSLTTSWNPGNSVSQTKLTVSTIAVGSTTPDVLTMKGSLTVTVPGYLSLLAGLNSATNSDDIPNGPYIVCKKL